MLVSTTINGVVIRRVCGWLTILLTTGKREEVEVVKTDLNVGDEVLMAYNSETGEVAGIHTTAPTIDLEAEPPIEKPEYPLWEDEE
jgi:uncharacterized protein YuzE